MGCNLASLKLMSCSSIPCHNGGEQLGCKDEHIMQVGDEEHRCKDERIMQVGDEEHRCKDECIMQVGDEEHSSYLGYRLTAVSSRVGVVM